MRNSDFDEDSLCIGLFIGTILGVVITALALYFGTVKQSQTECKELDGIQICRDIDYFPWKIREAK